MVKRSGKPYYRHGFGFGKSAALRNSDMKKKEVHTFTTLAPAPAPPTVVPTKAATSNVNVAPTKPSAYAPTKATTAGKAPVKAPASRPTTGTTPIPLGGRMTRSAALRAQKREETSAGNSPANSKASARPIARANSSMCCSLFRMAYEFGFINL